MTLVVARTLNNNKQTNPCNPPAFAAYFQHAVQTVLQMDVADPDDVYVIGGSHGGFLTAHLIGQYPVSSRHLSFNACVS